MVSESQFTFLRSIDTPTVCNLIEIVAPERRGVGYTASHLHCPFPDLPPMVGFAKTATIRARHPVSGSGYMQKRMDYLDYVRRLPARASSSSRTRTSLPVTAHSGVRCRPMCIRRWAASAQ